MTMTVRSLGQAETTPHPNARALVLGVLAAALMPPVQETVSTFARREIHVPDGPLQNRLWDPGLTPQLVEILDCLEPGRGWTDVTLRKSAQVGASVLALAWAGYLIAQRPCAMMIVMPTILKAIDHNRKKVQPLIDQSPALARRVNEVRSRSARSSRQLDKTFPGGSIKLVGANSSADLRSSTVKCQHRDEIDEYPDDLDGQGDPEGMLDARVMAFHATGDYMVFRSSTPTIAGASRIDMHFERGDQRYWQMPCPHCGTVQRFVFGSDMTKAGLRFEKQRPYRAHYVCVNGCVIEEMDKGPMIDAGRWIAERPGEGRPPSFHLDALSSKLTTWDHIAEAFLQSKDDPNKLKTFKNLWLGESWEERGEAPEWRRLMLARETWVKRSIPAGALVFTLAADVQGDGIYYEVTGWGSDQQSWSIDYGFLPGDTADPESPAWRALDEVYHREYPDAYGNRWSVDAAGIDSGYNTAAVYAWVRGKPKAYALKGEDGWSRPPLSVPKNLDITLGGKRRKRGLKIWQVGTWPLKAELYAQLRKEGPRDGHELVPPGYCHFAEFHDERYFKQLTAEVLKEISVRGRSVKQWAATGDNHLHDCRIYNMALAHHLGVKTMTEDEWLALKADRERVKPGRQTELFDTTPLAAAAENAAPPLRQDPAPPPPVRRAGRWIDKPARWI